MEESGQGGNELSAHFAPCLITYYFVVCGILHNPPSPDCHDLAANTFITAVVALTISHCYHHYAATSITAAVINEI